MSRAPYFLPYQVRWLRDKSRYKIAEKARRIGLTYAQSYEDTRDAARQLGCDVWFSSADESAAREYILYCKHWAEVIGAVAEDLGEVVIDDANDVRVLAIKFASGHRINALTSNPTRFNSKGGKVVLDEFAKHPDQDAMWRAAQPVTLHGYPLRVISTYEGKANRFYRMIEAAKRNQSAFALHSTTIAQAVDQGLADLIAKRPLTEAERAQFLAEARELAGDETTWQQEYMCNPQDEVTAWLSWDLIASCELDLAGDGALFDRDLGPCYLGYDIARRRHLSVMWVIQEVGDVFISREVVVMQGATFASQMAELRRLTLAYDVVRGCLDQGGMGEKMVEDVLLTDWGGGRMEGVLFSGAIKTVMANDVKRKFEDRRLRIPVRDELRDSLHSIRKITTVANNARFDAVGSQDHGDYFWALGLALHAAGDGLVRVEFESLGPRDTFGVLDRY